MCLRLLLFLALTSSVALCSPSDDASAPKGSSSLPLLHSKEDLENAIESQCVVAARENFETTTLLWLQHVFEEEAGVLVAQLDAMATPMMDTTGVLVVPRHVKDRECLLFPARVVARPKEFGVVQETLGAAASSLVDFVNRYCLTHRTATGHISSRGRLIDELLANLYRPPDATPTDATPHECERLDRIPSRDVFMSDYVMRNRPVVLEGALQALAWPALDKWTPQHFLTLLGSRKVHVKLTPDGDFEGVEPRDLWSDLKASIPEKVKAQLEFPDLVTVRPAPVDMPFTDFLDLIKRDNISAYIEYSSINAYMPELRDDMRSLDMTSRLQVEHENAWISNGRTIGRLHFDQYENTMCQVRGHKHFTLYDPAHNERLYEAHIPQAQYKYDRNNKSFSRATLLDSTSMVMSPVSLDHVNHTRFPLFSQARPLHCKLAPGDVLYLPAFWWHEVRSAPEHIPNWGPFNMAVNTWFTPLFQREYPCPRCPLSFNPHYLHLLPEPSD